MQAAEVLSYEHTTEQFVYADVGEQVMVQYSADTFLLLDPETSVVLTPGAFVRLNFGQLRVFSSAQIEVETRSGRLTLVSGELLVRHDLEDQRVCVLLPEWRHLGAAGTLDEALPNTGKLTFDQCFESEIVQGRWHLLGCPPRVVEE